MLSVSRTMCCQSLGLCIVSLWDYVLSVTPYRREVNIYTQGHTGLCACVCVCVPAMNPALSDDMFCVVVHLSGNEFKWYLKLTRTRHLCSCLKEPCVYQSVRQKVFLKNQVIPIQKGRGVFVFCSSSLVSVTWE